MLRDLGLAAAPPWQVAALAGALAFVWGLAILGFARARHARADPALALWSRLCRRLARAGLPRAPSEGPLAYVDRAAARWPRWSALLQRIGETYAALRYGPSDAGRSERISVLRAGIAALPSPRQMRSPG